MTLAIGLPSAERAFESARDLAERFAATAAGRDRERVLPHAEVEELSDAGLFALTVPARFGGPDQPPSAVAEVVRILATADSSLAQIPHSHYVYLTALRLAGSEGLQRRIFGEVLDGARIANAQSERGGATAAEIATTLTRTPSGARVDGEKFYCTGSPYAHLLAVLARDAETGAQVIAFVPADAPGITIVDDWNGLGQRTTGSGTVRFADVSVPLDAVVPRSPAVSAPTGYGAFAQLLHVAIDTGLARGALEASAEFVRTRSRPWFESGVERAQDDPLLAQRFGELTVTVRAAEAALTVAASAVDGAFAAPGPDAAAHASLAVATAKVLADRAATEVPAALFEVSGTRSAGSDLGLDRYWRDGRTHTLHDPLRYKLHHLGRFTLNEERPPLHGVV